MTSNLDCLHQRSIVYQAGLLANFHPMLGAYLRAGLTVTIVSIPYLGVLKPGCAYTRKVKEYAEEESRSHHMGSIMISHSQDICPCKHILHLDTLSHYGCNTPLSTWQPISLVYTRTLCSLSLISRVSPQWWNTNKRVIGPERKH